MNMPRGNDGITEEIRLALNRFEECCAACCEQMRYLSISEFKKRLYGSYLFDHSITMKGAQALHGKESNPLTGGRTDRNQNEPKQRTQLYAQF